MKKILLLCGLLCPCALFSPVHAHEAHEHGAAKVNIAVDGARVNIGLESPLANFLPFEHAPATPEQREQVRDMARRLRRAESLFRFAPEAECRLEKAAAASESLDAALLDPDLPPDPSQGVDDKKRGGEKNEAAGGEHGDLDAEFVFFCSRPEHARGVEILLFSVWPKLERAEVQVVAPGGQRAAVLTAKKRVLSW